MSNYELLSVQPASSRRHSSSRSSAEIQQQRGSCVKVWMMQIAERCTTINGVTFGCRKNWNPLISLVLVQWASPSPMLIVSANGGGVTQQSSVNLVCYRMWSLVTQSVGQTILLLPFKGHVVAVNGGGWCWWSWSWWAAMKCGLHGNSFTCERGFRVVYCSMKVRPCGRRQGALSLSDCHKESAIEGEAEPSLRFSVWAV